MEYADAKKMELKRFGKRGALAEPFYRDRIVEVLT